MSDTSPFGGPTEDELLQMLLQYSGGTLPGKTPSAQLNYYQDLVSTLGVDPVQQAGLGQEPQPEPYAAPLSVQRTALGSNPIYAEVFDRIDSGQDPLSAFNETKAAHPKDGPKWENDFGELSDDAKAVKKAANDYAFEQAKNARDEDTYTRENAPASGYTKVDGSKYKNAPIGGNGIYDTASEYDLLGAPTIEDLLATYTKDHPTLIRGSAQATRGVTPGGHGSSGNVTADMAPRPQQLNEYGEAFGRLPGKAPKVSKETKSHLGWNNVATDEGKVTVNGQAVDTSGPFRGSKMEEDAFKLQSQKRIDKTKGTRVRSDANTNYMRRILALRTILGA